MQNLVKSDAQWKRIQGMNFLTDWKNDAGRPIRFANRTDALRRAPKPGFDSRKVRPDKSANGARGWKLNQS